MSTETDRTTEMQTSDAERTISPDYLLNLPEVTMTPEEYHAAAMLDPDDGSAIEDFLASRGLRPGENVRVIIEGSKEAKVVGTNPNDFFTTNRRLSRALDELLLISPENDDNGLRSEPEMREVGGASLDALVLTKSDNSSETLRTPEAVEPKEGTSVDELQAQLELVSSEIGSIAEVLNRGAIEDMDKMQQSEDAINELIAGIRSGIDGLDHGDMMRAAVITQNLEEIVKILSGQQKRIDELAVGSKGASAQVEGLVHDRISALESDTTVLAADESGELQTAVDKTTALGNRLLGSLRDDVIPKLSEVQHSVTDRQALVAVMNNQINQVIDFARAGSMDSYPITQLRQMTEGLSEASQVSQIKNIIGAFKVLAQ